MPETVVSMVFFPVPSERVPDQDVGAAVDGFQEHRCDGMHGRRRYPRLDLPPPRHMPRRASSTASPWSRRGGGGGMAGHLPFVSVSGGGSGDSAL